MNYEHFLERIHFRNNKVCKNITRQKILSKVQLASYELIFAGKPKKIYTDIAFLNIEKFFLLLGDCLLCKNVRKGKRGMNKLKNGTQNKLMEGYFDSVNFD